MRIFVVAGPPCAGKTTYVHDMRDPRDVVIDLDTLAHALGDLEHPTRLGGTHPARQLAQRARASVIKGIREISRHHEGTTVWVIATDGTVKGLFPDRTITLNPGPAECHRRAVEAARPDTTAAEINAWYARHGSSSSRPA